MLLASVIFSLFLLTFSLCAAVFGNSEKYKLPRKASYESCVLSLTIFSVEPKTGEVLMHVMSVDSRRLILEAYNSPTVSRMSEAGQFDDAEAGPSRLDGRPHQASSSAAVEQSSSATSKPAAAAAAAADDEEREYDSEEMREYYAYLRDHPEEADAYYEEDSDFEEEDEEAMGRVEDADWELSRGDFTKAFNRSRQADAVLRGEASKGTVDGATVASSSGTTNAAPLPAMNRRARPRPQPSAAATAAAAAAAASASAAGSGAGANGGLTAAQLQQQHKDKTEAQLAALSNRFGARLSLLQEAYDPSLSVGGRLGGANVPRKALGDAHARVKDKADRATNQQVLDPRTMLILFKMVQRGLLEVINGVVSTGKEANVYHAFAPAEAQGENTAAEVGAAASKPASDAAVETRKSLALKIYKTSILVFKDRDRYVSGEFRFRHGYSRHNPRKMVRLWAEKESRNLKRLFSAGLRAPQVVELRDHVLVMEFLGGADGWASPRLRDAEKIIDAEEQAEGSKGQGSRWTELYLELLAATRIMYQHCRLVHADLSEYNIL